MDTFFSVKITYFKMFSDVLEPILTEYQPDESKTSFL